MKIYLAGKIEKNCWRHEVVDGLRSSLNLYEIGDDSKFLLTHMPPVLEGAIFGHDYVGPFFASCDHGGGHGPNTHGIEGTGEGLCCTGSELTKSQTWERRRAIREWCLAGVAAADLVFVWNLDCSAYGSIFEVGYAEAIGKRIVFGHSTEQLSDDLWFASMAGDHVHGENAGVALQAAISLQTLVNATPIESAFWEAWVAKGYPPLQHQQKVLKYFVDFAHLPTKTAIELDGLRGHSTPADIEKDRRRQREIEAEGWRFIRFGGREIHHEAERCAKEAHEFIRDRS